MSEVEEEKETATPLAQISLIQRAAPVLATPRQHGHLSRGEVVVCAVWVVRMAKRSVSPNWKAIDPLGTRTGNASAEPGLSANHGRDVVSLPGAPYRLGIPIRPAAVPSLTHERETPPATPLTGLRLACQGSVRWPFATGNGSTRLGMAFPHPEEARAPSLLCCLRRLEQLSC
jgi:hypothetical protein